MSRTTRPLRAALSVVGVLALAMITITVLAEPAAAEARVTVRNDRGGSEADNRYRTRLSIDGAGFQAVRGGFGGVYVAFGWVSDPGGGAWRPSRGGLTGQDYRYVPDSEDAAANAGYLRFVAFPGSSTSGEAQAVMTRSGGFEVTLTVPGPVFQSVDRNGDLATVDCRTTTCGVISFGAHGVINAANETFTRVPFGNVYETAPATVPPAAPSSGTQGGTSPAPPAGETTPSDAPARPTGKPKVTADRATAVSGRALAFTGQGFTPGEQVLAILDDGVAALGPMAAGASGEVAGVLQLPLTLEPGTHTLRLSGAASGTEVSENFPIRAADEVADQPAPVAVADEATIEASRLFLLAASVVFLAALALLLVRRRHARPALHTEA